MKGVIQEKAKRVIIGRIKIDRRTKKKEVVSSDCTCRFGSYVKMCVLNWVYIVFHLPQETFYSQEH